MNTPQIGIVGFGVVGKVHYQALLRAGIATAVFDKFIPEYRSPAHAKAINECELVFLCVPTPSRPDGSCDVSSVEEVVGWVTQPMCIKSTVPPGTTARLVAESGKQIVFSPEYTGETAFHPHKDRLSTDVVAVGGRKDLAEHVVGIYTQLLGPDPLYIITDAATAELAKYMENCFFATKVAFVAQFHLLAKSFGADFTTLREIWAADRRIGRSHSTIVGAPGFSGRCLPKDLSAILIAAQDVDCPSDLLDAVHSFNELVRSESRQSCEAIEL